MTPTSAPHPDACLADGGEARALLRAIDWGKNPLGPARQWPRSFETLVSAMRASRFARRILWGPEQMALTGEGVPGGDAGAKIGERGPFHVH